MKNNALPRSRILRGRKVFNQLFENGKVLKSGNLLFRYLVLNDKIEFENFKINRDYCQQAAPACGFITAFVVKKKSGNAPKRNTLKRRLREVFRTNPIQKAICEVCDSENKVIISAFVILGGDNVIGYNSLKKNLNNVLEKLLSHHT